MINPLATAWVSDGYDQKVVGDQNDWLMGAALAQLEGLILEQTEESVWNSDPNVLDHAHCDTSWTDGIYWYSWSLQSWIDLGRPDLTTPLWFLVLPVACPTGWFCEPITPPPGVQRAICCQSPPDNSFPVSQPLVGDAWVWFVDCDDPAVDQKSKDEFWQYIVDHPVCNVKCDALMAGHDGVYAHTHLEQDIRILKFAARCHRSFCQKGS